MALDVILCVPPPVKITHVIYKVEHVWIVNKEYMVAIVTCRAPLTVKTTYVIYKMDHALPVCQDEPECIVKQVRIQHGNMLITEVPLCYHLRIF